MQGNLWVVRPARQDPVCKHLHYKWSFVGTSPLFAGVLSNITPERSHLPPAAPSAAATRRPAGALCHTLQEVEEARPVTPAGSRDPSSRTQQGRRCRGITS